MLLAWNRLTLSGDRPIRLNRQPGSDTRGMTGLSDRTDHHWGSMLRAALILILSGSAPNSARTAMTRSFECCVTVAGYDQPWGGEAPRR